MKLEYIVEEEILVKEFLKEKNLSRKLLRKIKNQDGIFINGERAKNYFLLHKGDKLEIVVSESINGQFESSDIPLDILYEDDNYLIVNKDKGIAIQPSRRHFHDNLLSAIKSYYERQGIEANIHIVTRLDLDTTGIVLVAKSGYVHSLLNDIEYEKEYLCKCYNKFINLDGEFSDKIRRVKEDSIKRWVFSDGKSALTIYHVLENSDTPLVLCKLKTGRTHQIRVHFAYNSHPLLGDKLYGVEDDYDLMLHAYRLSFISPVDGKTIEVVCEPKWNK